MHKIHHSSKFGLVDNCYSYMLWLSLRKIFVDLSNIGPLHVLFQIHVQPLSLDLDGAPLTIITTPILESCFERKSNVPM